MLLASGRQSDRSEGVFFIGDSRIYAKEGSAVKAGSVYLGRPWGEHALAGVQSSYLSEIINSTGWDVWRHNDTHIGDGNNVNFYEYGNYGPGAEGKRPDFAYQLKQPVRLDQIFNSTDWINEKYITL